MWLLSRPFALTFALLAIPSLAQEPGGSIDEDREALARLEEIEASLVSRGEWQPAVEALQGLIESGRETPCPLGDGRYVALPEFCHRRIAALPAEGRARYRDLYDSRAREHYERGRAEHDLASLERVRRDYFCTSWGDEALHLLATFLIDREEFDRAARALESIAPVRPGIGLVHPDPDIPSRSVLVPLAICLAELGDRAAVRLVQDRLASLADPAPLPPGFEEDLKRRQARAVAHPGRDAAVEEWPTLHGGPGRANRSRRAMPDVLALEWTWPVSEEPDVEDRREAHARVAGDRGHLLSAVMPIVRDGCAFFKVHGPRPLVAIELHDGSLRWEGEDEPPAADAWRFFGDYAWNLLSSHGDLVFSIETPAIGADDPTEPPRNWIAAYGIRGNGERAAILGGRQPAEEHLGRAWFLSAPEAGNDLLVAPARVGEDLYLYAFRQGSLAFRWRTKLSTGPGAPVLPAGGEGTFLAIGGGTAFCASGSGVVAAVDLATGRLIWLVRYESASPERVLESPPGGWEPSPPVLAEGRLVVAPAGGEHLLCLDAVTGKEVWRQPRCCPHQGRIREQTVLLGYSRGLIYTTGPGGVAARWLRDGRDGRAMWSDAHLGGDLEWWSWAPAAGRGLLTDEHLYLPGVGRDDLEAIFEIELRSGKVVRRLHPRSRPGNLLLVDGGLLSATAEEVVALSANGRHGGMRRSRRDKEVERLLERAEHLAEIEGPRAACRELQRILEERGDRIGRRRSKGWAPVPELVHEAVLGLGPAGVEAHRDLYDVEARDRLEGAIAALDEEGVASVHRDFFPSSVGDDAAYWLARLEMDRGQWRRAIRLLDEIDAAGDAAIRHPDPSVPADRVLERLAICHAARGEWSDVDRLLARGRSCLPRVRDLLERKREAPP